MQTLFSMKTCYDASQQWPDIVPCCESCHEDDEKFGIEMMEVGEESGTTDDVLAEVAAFYETEVDQTMKNLSSIMEPVIMMVIGAVVGVLAVALVSPIYNITQNIN